MLRLPSLSALGLMLILGWGSLSSFPAQALSLVHSRVVSPSGAPLQVVVDLVDLTPSEQQNLTVSLADADAWQRAGVTPPVALSTLSLNVERGTHPGHRRLRVTATAAAVQPIVDLLLEISDDGGLRQVQLSIMQTATGFPGLMLPASAAMPGSAVSSSRSSIRVRPGDTLYGIAQSHRIDDVTLYQMMAALWRANPQAFIQKNMNLVKSGARLVIPDAAVARVVDPDQARHFFLAHIEAYSRYRASLAGAAARGAVVTQAAVSQETVDSAAVNQATVKQTAGHQEVIPSGSSEAESPAAAPAPSPPASSEQDHLRLSNAQDASEAARDQVHGDVQTALTKASREAEIRVEELERNVKALNAALVTAAATTAADTVSQDGSMQDTVVRKTPDGVEVPANGEAVGSEIAEDSSVLSNIAAAAAVEMPEQPLQSLQDPIQHDPAPPPSSYQGPASGLPSWLSESLLIALIIVLTMTACVLVWLWQRAVARRDNEFDEWGDEFYSSEFEKGGVEGRQPGSERGPGQMSLNEVAHHAPSSSRT